MKLYIEKSKEKQICSHFSSEKKDFLFKFITQRNQTNKTIQQKISL
jgi:hypothetical protein